MPQIAPQTDRSSERRAYDSARFRRFGVVHASFLKQFRALGL